MRKTSAVSTLEYVLLITIIMTAFLLTQKYILRAFAGRWRQVGDTFGFSRQYDPKKTTECLWYEETDTWYVPQCFDEKMNARYPQSCNCSDIQCWDSCKKKAEIDSVNDCASDVCNPKLKIPPAT